ncbi:MAG TPA: DUF6178 family protein [Kofleriaceae bacterium]|jgi:hypothetical protein|nr:DUF6178 family protein [Kofleriaceae bacterium]
MSERDVPSSIPSAIPSATLPGTALGGPLGKPLGPLDRIRTQLAGPRGYRRIDALLSSDDAAGAIAQLSPGEIFELVHEVGFEDAADLIHLATPAQIQGCFDLDGWARDELDVAPLRPWLSSLLDAGFEKFGEVWGQLDSELRTLILQRQVKIYDTTLGEAPAENDDAPIYVTPDQFFQLELLGDDASQRLVMQMVEDLYRADAGLARHTIMAARSEPPAELEETSYRWRSGRLADLGYVDFYDALDLFRPLDPAQVEIGEGSQDRMMGEDTRLPVVVAEQVIGRSFLARALAAINDPMEADRLEAALMVLVNKVLAAGRAKPGQAEVVDRGALYATATLSLGLETIVRGDVERAPHALGSVALERLFRVGYTVTQKLARLAVALAPRSVLAGSPAKELVSALCSPRPLFARAADEPPAVGVRPFEAAADLGRAGEILTGLTVRIALVEGLGVDVVAAGQAPEPRPSLDDHIRTALARAVVGGEFSGHALSQPELTELRDRGMVEGRLTSLARAAGHAQVRSRLGAAQLSASGPIVARLVDRWLDDLGSILGAIKDAEIDPRYVEGVLVEVKRS